MPHPRHAGRRLRRHCGPKYTHQPAATAAAAAAAAAAAGAPAPYVGRFAAGPRHGARDWRVSGAAAGAAAPAAAGRRAECGHRRPGRARYDGGRPAGSRQGPARAAAEYLARASRPAAAAAWPRPREQGRRPGREWRNSFFFLCLSLRFHCADCVIFSAFRSLTTLWRSQGAGGKKGRTLRPRSKNGEGTGALDRGAASRRAAAAKKAARSSEPAAEFGGGGRPAGPPTREVAVRDPRYDSAFALCLRRLRD